MAFGRGGIVQDQSLNLNNPTENQVVFEQNSPGQDQANSGLGDVFETAFNDAREDFLQSKAESQNISDSSRALAPRGVSERIRVPRGSNSAEAPEVTQLEPPIQAKPVAGPAAQKIETAPVQTVTPTPLLLRSPAEIPLESIGVTEENIATDQAAPTKSPLVGDQIYSQNFNALPEGQPNLADKRAIQDLIGDNVTYIKGFGANSQVNDSADQRGREAAGQINEANDIVRLSIDDGALKALYPQGGNTSSHSGVQYIDEIANKDPTKGPLDEVLINYKVKFDEEFPWQSGGKLPGVIVKESYTSDDPKDSIRLMWREDGELEFYIHTPDDRTRLAWDNGDDQLGHAALADGEWQDIQFRVKLNDFKNGNAVANGELEAWLNGQHAGYYDDVILRDSPQDDINTFFFSTFYGGSSGNGNIEWWPQEDSSALFDDISIEAVNS